MLNLIDQNTAKQNALFWAKMIECILSRDFQSSMMILDDLFHSSECIRAENETLLSFKHQFVFFEIKSNNFMAFQTLRVTPSSVCTGNHRA